MVPLLSDAAFLLLDQSKFLGLRRSLPAAGNTEFPTDALYVGLDGLGENSEFFVVIAVSCEQWTARTRIHVLIFGRGMPVSPTRSGRRIEQRFYENLFLNSVRFLPVINSCAKRRGRRLNTVAALGDER